MKNTLRFLLYILASLVLSMLFNHVVLAQCPKVPQQVNTYYEWWGAKHKNILQLPRVAPLASCRDTGMAYYDPSDSLIHWWTGFTDRTFLARADQGLFDSTHTVQLGEPLSQSGSPSRLYQNREVPANGKAFTWWDSLNAVSGGYMRFNDTAHSGPTPVYVVQNIYQADTIHDFYNFAEWRPKNYGYLYSGYKPNGALAKAMSWSFGYSQNDAGGLSMPDNVYGGGYNTVNGVGRRDTGDAALPMRIETSFPVNGEPNFEMHWPELITFTGSQFRINSWYMGKTTGRTLWESNLDQHQYKRVVGTTPGPVWLEFTDNSGDFASILLHGTHNNSIQGIISFVDSNGATEQIRGLEGQLQFLSSGVGLSNYMDIDGSMYLNFSANAALSNGTTIIGNYPSSIPSTDLSAQLKVISTTKGFLPPYMTTTQKLAIANPADGLMVSDITLHTISRYNGTRWIDGKGVYSGGFSGVGAATTVFTVTMGPTLESASYQVNVTPTNALSAALLFVTNKTTTTFDVTYLAPLTGSVAFDWTVTQ